MTGPAVVAFAEIVARPKSHCPKKLFLRAGPEHDSQMHTPSLTTVLRFPDASRCHKRRSGGHFPMDDQHRCGLSLCTCKTEAENPYCSAYCEQAATIGI